MNVPLTLLGLLEREPSHGYDLKRDYDTYFGRGKPLPFGQVYATLGRLARDGKVIAAETEPGSGPDRKRYVITEQGVSDLETWLTTPVEAEPHLQSVLFVKVVLALMSGRPAQRYLDAQRAAHLQRMRELTELRRNGELVDALLADHGLFHLEADLRWIDLTAARLDALTKNVSGESRPSRAAIQRTAYGKTGNTVEESRSSATADDDNAVQAFAGRRAAGQQTLQTRSGEVRP